MSHGSLAAARLSNTVTAPADTEAAAVSSSAAIRRARVFMRCGGWVELCSTQPRSAMKNAFSACASSAESRIHGSMWHGWMRTAGHLAGAQPWRLDCAFVPRLTGCFRGAGWAASRRTRPTRVWRARAEPCRWHALQLSPWSQMVLASVGKYLSGSSDYAAAESAVRESCGRLVAVNQPSRRDVCFHCKADTLKQQMSATKWVDIRPEAGLLAKPVFTELRTLADPRFTVAETSGATPAWFRSRKARSCHCA